MDRLHLPEDLCHAINSNLRPLKTPPLLCLDFQNEEGGLVFLQSDSITTLPDELDLATMLWRLQLHVEEFCLINDGSVPDTTCLQLNADNMFVALWTCWRNNKKTGVSYEFRHHSGAIFSGRRRKADMQNNIADWDQKLALFHALPDYKFAGKDSFVCISGLKDGLHVELQAVCTGPRFMRNFRFRNAHLSIKKPH